MTTSTTTKATELARDLTERAREASREERAAHEAIDTHRRAMYEAEAAQTDAHERTKTAMAEVRALLRALAHRTEEAPIIEPNEHTAYEPDRVTYRATFGSTTASTRQSTAGYSSKPKPRVASAYRYSDRATLYESPRGTSDPAKLAAELATATAAALAAVQDLTAAAWLRARGIDPATAPDPAELVNVVAVSACHWYGNDRCYSACWSLALDGEALADGPVIYGATELARAIAERAGTYDREAIYDAPERHKNTREAADAYAQQHAAEALAELVAKL